jgi:hypothetical protein
MFKSFLSKLSLTDVTDVTETRTKIILATVIVKWTSKTASNFNRKETTRSKKLKVYKKLLKNTAKMKNNLQKTLKNHKKNSQKTIKKILKN